MGEDLKAMRYSVLRNDGGDSDGVVSNIDGFRHEYGLGLGIDGSLSVLVLEGDTSAEAFFVA